MAKFRTEQRILLLDEARFMTPPTPEAQAVFDARYVARRYVFDREASARVGQFNRECLDLVVDNIEFARTPYPTCYFEFDPREHWRHWRPDQPVQETHDKRAGFLVHNGSVLVLASGNKVTEKDRGEHFKTVELTDLPPAIGFMSFRINRPQTVPMTQLAGVDEFVADRLKQAYVLGGQRGPHKDPSEFSDKTWVFLPDLPKGWSHSQIAQHYDVRPVLRNFPRPALIECMFLGGGDPLILTTMLLLLNQPSKCIDLVHVPQRRGIWKGNPKSFREHHVVTIHLAAHEHVRRMLSTTDRASPVGHEVHGHWKNYNKSENCNHHFEDGRQAWEPVGADRTISGDYKRYWCPLCLQRRTWTEDFTRGDASAGFITTEYEVKR